MRTWGAGVVLAVVLTACGTGVREVRNVGGEPIYEAKCKSSGADCIADAREKCRGGYELLDSESHAGGAVADAMPGPVTWYSMTFKCNGFGQSERPDFAWRGSTYEPPATGGGETSPAPLAERRPTTSAPAAYAPAAPTQPMGPKECRSDYDCGFGNVCAKPQGSFSGTCGQAVNEVGTPTFPAARPNSIGPGGEGQCGFDTDCPVGFKCVKGTSLRGNCMK